MADNARVSERRLAMRLMAYWQELRGDRECAMLADLRQDAIPDIWDDCFIVSPGSADGRPMFRHLGESIASQSGVPATRDLDPANVPQATLLGAAMRDMSTAKALRYPSLDSGEFQAADGTGYLFRSILLPLSDEQGVIKHVLGGARCRPVHEDS